MKLAHEINIQMDTYCDEPISLKSARFMIFNQFYIINLKKKCTFNVPYFDYINFKNI